MSVAKRPGSRASLARSGTGAGAGRAPDRLALAEAAVDETRRPRCAETSPTMYRFARRRRRAAGQILAKPRVAHLGEPHRLGARERPWDSEARSGRAPSPTASRRSSRQEPLAPRRLPLSFHASPPNVRRLLDSRSLTSSTVRRRSIAQSEPTCAESFLVSLGRLGGTRAVVVGAPFGRFGVGAKRRAMRRSALTLRAP